MPTAAHAPQYYTVNPVTVNADDEVVLDLNHGNRFHWADATGTVEILGPNNPIAGPYYQEFKLLVETAATGPTVTYPDSWEFAAAEEPTMGNDATRWFHGETWDGGTTWIVRHDSSFAAPA